MEFEYADISLKNVSVLEGTGYGITSKNNRFSAESVSISKVYAYGLILTAVRDARVDAITVDPTVRNPALYLDRVIGTFRGMHVPDSGTGVIQVSSGSSAVKFEGLSPEGIKNIEWKDGAIADGPVKGYEPDVVEETQANEAKEVFAYFAKHEAEAKARHSKRARHTRAFQQKLHAAKDQAETLDALYSYCQALITEPKGEHDDEYDDSYWSQPIASELRALAKEFGQGAVDLAIKRFPQPPPALFTAIEYYERCLPQDMTEALSRFRAKASIDASFDLAKVIATWKTADGAKEPNLAAAKFYDMAKEISAKAQAATQDEKQLLKGAIMAELTPFIEKQGYAALDELLNLLTQTPLVVLTADDVRAQLTAQQKRALTKHLLK
jgi:hypothetical protein